MFMLSVEFLYLNAGSLSWALLIVGYNVCFQGKCGRSARLAIVLPGDEKKKKRRRRHFRKYSARKLKRVPFFFKHVYLILNNEGLQTKSHVQYPSLS